MQMHKRDEDWKRQEEAIQRKYQRVLRKISEMPADVTSGKKGELGARYQYLKSQPEFEQMQLDILEYCGAIPGRGNDYRIENKKATEDLYANMMDALYETVCTYDMDKGLFAGKVKYIGGLKEKAGKQQLFYNPTGLKVNNEKELIHIVRLIRSMQNDDISDKEKEKSFMEQLLKKVNKALLQEALEKKKKQEGEHAVLTEEERNAQKITIQKLRNAFFYQDVQYVSAILQERDDDSGDNGIVDLSADEAVRRQQEQEQDEEDREVFITKMDLLEDLMDIDSYRAKKSEVKRKEALCYYVAREILKELKLVRCTNGISSKDEIPENMKLITLGRTNYYQYILPPGKKWQEGIEDAAGDSRIYAALMPKEDLVMRLIPKRYLHDAIVEDPEDRDHLFGTYYNFLQETFTFENSYDPQIFNEKHGQQLSRFRKEIKEMRGSKDEAREQTKLQQKETIRRNAEKLRNSSIWKLS